MMSAITQAEAFSKEHLVNALILALTDAGTNDPQWVALREIKLRMANAQVALTDAGLRGWLVGLVQKGKVETRKNGEKDEYRLVTEDPAAQPTIATPIKVPAIPPRAEWPEWVKYRIDLIANDRDRTQDENIALRKRVEELELKVMDQEKSLVITQYGDSKSLATVKERVALTPYGHNLDERGRAMVAQVCYLLDWNPFFDMHAFKGQGGKLCLMPDYKKLMSMAKEQQRINHKSRPMTPQERQEQGLKDDQVGYVTEVKEIDILLDFARAGIADQYEPVIGYGIWSPGDNIPNTWTAAMVAKKRSIRNALYQLTNYKIVTKRFRDALMQAGALAVGDDDDGFIVDMPEQIEAETGSGAGDYWDDPQQRQAFWKAAKIISSKKAEIAEALKFEIDGDPNDSANWKPHMAQFPDLENAIAYVNVVAENIKQDTPDIDPETGEVLAVKCEKCNEHDATGEDPFPALCALCATKAGDDQAAKDGQK